MSHHRIAVVLTLPTAPTAPPIAGIVAHAGADAPAAAAAVRDQLAALFPGAAVYTRAATETETAKDPA